MEIKFLQIKRPLRAALLVLLLSVVGMTKAQTENITFADATVKAICVTHWDTDGDGELNQAEAAAVTSLSGVFMFDDEITTFDELQFFIGLASIGEDEFNSCTSLASITIPNAVTSIGNYAFSDCSSLTSMTSYACTPPALGNEVFYNVPSVVVLNVPCHTAVMYQEADGWSDFSNYEEFEYGLCPIPFADATVKAICVAHWDTNEDGELSYAEAAAVTNLGTYFKSTAITSFDELEYFTSLTSLPNTAFYGCTSLASIALPSSVSALGNGSFYNCTNLATMTVYAETPPTVGTNAFKNVPIDMAVYVPCGTYVAYHTADGWSEFTILQQSGLCPIVFADANVKALCVANWDTNGDGELSYDEAAAVTDLGHVFRNKSITSFNELQYFTGLTSIGSYAFERCTGLIAIEIPNSLSSIENDAFYSCTGLAAIEFPISVTSIGSLAFGRCIGLTMIEIPSSVTSIENDAFSYCTGLAQIIVDVGNIVYDSRENCEAIIKTNTNELVIGCKNTVIPNSVTSIGWYAFNGCSGLTSVVIPNSVTLINSYAFMHCTGLTSIEIPNSVTSIGTNPFADCSGIEQIIVDSGNVVYDSRENCNAIIRTGTNGLVTGCKNTVIPDLVTNIGWYAFYGCDGLTSIEIPNSVTSIGWYAFKGCSELTSIASFAETPPTLGIDVFGSVLTSIPIYVPCVALEDYQAANGWSSFTNVMGLCSGEVSVVVYPSEGGTVTGIGYYTGGDVCVLTATPNPGFVFGNWMENEIVVSMNPEYSFYAHPTTIVAKFVPIGNIVFADTNVKAMCVANWDTNGDGELSYAEAAVVTDLGEVFRNKSITSFNELQYFINLASIGKYAFMNCNSLTTIAIPNSVTTIENYAFYSCSDLTLLEIPSSVTMIGTMNPFAGCRSLEQIIVTSDNVNYDSRENCNAIINTSTNALVSGCKNTVIPNSVTSIGWDAFYYCTGLTNIEIPNSVISIGDDAFAYCSSLTSVEIPSSVTSIGNYAFSRCTSLTLLASFADISPTLGNDVFFSVNKSIPVYVPCGASMAYQSTNGWNEFTNIRGMCPGTITVAATPTEGGSVTGGGSYEGGGVTCTLTANANHDYCFLNWTEDGEVVSSDAEYTFTVAGDRSLVANFSFMPPAPVVAEYYPDPNESNSPYVKVHWATSLFEAQIGEGNYTNFGYFPFYTLYNYSIAENLFLASELEAAGVSSFPMTSMSWYATNAPGYEQQGISIWMANVSDTELNTTSHTVSGMTLVYTGAMTPEIGWNEFVFNEGNFVWDGVNNVLILCQRNNGVWNNTVWWRTDDVGYNASSYSYTDDAPYNVNIANTMNTSTKRPNIIMKGEGSMTYNLYRANCDGTDAQLIAENLNDTQYIDETWWQLENDSYKYGVSIADSTNTDIFWSNCIEKQGDVVVQTCALSQGWNWFSTNVEVTLDDLKTALLEALPGTAISIKSQTQNTSYNPINNRWVGSLAWDVAKMYMIKVATNCEITLTGMPIHPAEHPVTILNGANWIGFPFNSSLTLSNAFAGFAVNGDKIKSQTNNALYNGIRWQGQLNTLEPNKGYIYISNSSDDRIFTFPTNAK